MRRKRRNRGTWFPVLGHIVGDLQEEFYPYADARIFTDPVPNDNVDGGSQRGPLPLIPDFTPEQSQNTADLGSSLHDRVSGQAWLLQRIVGKIHLHCRATEGTNPLEVWEAIYVTFGILVARSEDDAQGVCDLTAKEADAQHVDNVMNPWVFRRSWMLGNESVVSPLSFPCTTGQYGSVLDGPHIDSKVKRIISAEHRLWYVVTARGYNSVSTDVSGSTENQPSVAGLFDYRIFGSLIRNKNTSSF